MGWLEFLVTGGAGFIGSHLCESLAEKGVVGILDDFSTGRRENVPEGAEVVNGSFAEPGILEKALEGTDVVFHLAGIVGVQESVENPLRTMEVNSLGTFRLLECAERLGVRKVVFCSSASVYGNASAMPQTEESLPVPLSPYAVSKLDGEYFAKIFSEQTELKATSLRLFNVYGPRQKIGGAYSAVIPRFIKNALEGKTLEVSGDGTQSRDFVFVKDVVSAMLSCVGKGDGEIINIGCGKSISINSLAQEIIELTGSGTETTHVAGRKGEVMHSLAEISKARRLLGFEPKYPLRHGLKETIKFFE